MGAREALPHKAGGIIRARGPDLFGNCEPQPHQLLKPLRRAIGEVFVSSIYNVPCMYVRVL